MSRIPDKTAITRKTVHIAPDIARIDLSAAGSGMAAIGRSIGDLEAANTEAQIAKAEADFLIMKTEQESAYDQDEDYETIQERHSGAMNEGLGEFASRIGNPRARSKFVERSRVGIAASEERMAGVAWGKEVDAELAEMQERTDKLKDSGWKGGDQGMIDSHAAAIGMYQAARDQGYITEQERVELTKRFKTDLAIGRLEMMDPADRVQALGQPWADNLPENVKGRLMREATAAQLEDRAVGIVDGYMDDIKEGASDDDIISKLRKIDDNKLRKAAEARFKDQNNMRKNAETSTRKDLWDKWYTKIASQEARVEDISEEELLAMGGDVERSLRAAQRQVLTATDVPFSMEHFTAVQGLLMQTSMGVDGASRELVDYIAKNGHEFSQDQAKLYGKYSMQAGFGLLEKNVLKDQTYAFGLLPASSQVEDRRIIVMKAGQWRQWYIDTFKKMPSEDERNVAMNGLVKEQLHYKGVFQWGDETKPIYLMNQEELTQAVTIAREDPEVTAYVDAFMMKEYGSMPPVEIQLKHYRRGLEAKRKGLLTKRMSAVQLGKARAAGKSPVPDVSGSSSGVIER